MVDLMRWQVVALVVGLGWSAPGAGAESHLMRQADVHQDRVVFTYEGDLWLASTNGGDAVRITDDPGTEQCAKFSPDGSLIAFTANYDGGTDVYVMDAKGGSPRRLTYHPSGDFVLEWYPDGKSILFRSRREFSFRAEQVYRVSVDGGMEEKLPVDRAGLSSLSPDGKMIAYNRITRETATWKRHQGGTAQDIWVGDLEKGTFEKITDWVGTDNYPMWQGDAIYFTSDREHGTLNVYKYDLATKKVSALTGHADYDVKYPSIGPGAIIYQYAETLYLLDLKSGQERKLDITIPTDWTRMRPSYVSATGKTGAFSLSPTGTRMLIETRGEVVNVPVKKGEPINLTAASGSRERNGAWSPDGRWIAFLSDKTGEEEWYLVDQKAQQPWRQLTKGNKGWRMPAVWSPDSKWLVFGDKFMRLNLVDAESGAVTLIDQGEYDDGWERWGIRDYVWSPDSKWIAYAKQEQNLNQSVFLYSLADQKVLRVTSDMTQDWSPTFDPQGRYLYFLSERTYEPIMSFVDQSHVFLNMCRPYIFVLEGGKASPFAPEDSEETVKAAPAEKAKDEDQGEKGEATGEKPDKAEGEKTAAGKDETKPVKIDLDDCDRRIVAAEGIPAGNYFRLEATEKGFLYLKKEEHQFSKYQTVSDETGDSLDLYYYEVDAKDPEERKPKKLISGINNYHQSADGKKVVYRSGGTYGVLDVCKEGKVGDGKVDLGGVRIKIDKREEFMQMFNEAWRIERDWFYDPGMHGVDWAAVGEMYRKFVPFCGNRSDLNYLIGEMIGELNAGHTYVSGGDDPSSAKHVSTSLLGVEFDTPQGAPFHRIARIIPGLPWNPAESSPLAVPGCPIKEGDYLIAINGRQITSKDNIYQFLENLTDRVVTISYNSAASAEGAKTQRVRTIGSEGAIRYREWIERNRTAVDKASKGLVGYVHVPDMGESGLIEFAKAWHPQHTRQGMIIDARYNGGGFTGDMMIDQIERKLWAVTKPREGKTVRDPEKTFHGHIVVLINEDTGSNGEYFAEAIKIKGLGTVIGMRTWGGAVGIEPHEDLVDGGSVTPPQFAPYGLQRKWLIEGHGVVPDIEVQNMPGDVIRGKDAQLEASIGYLMDKLAKEPMALPEPPEYPKKAK
jgi:tricorn protease